MDAFKPFGGVPRLGKGFGLARIGRAGALLQPGLPRFTPAPLMAIIGLGLKQRIISPMPDTAKSGAAEAEFASCDPTAVLLIRTGMAP